jgi:hypothetical protein
MVEYISNWKYMMKTTNFSLQKLMHPLITLEACSETCHTSEMQIMDSPHFILMETYS